MKGMVIAILCLVSIMFVGFFGQWIRWEIIPFVKNKIKARKKK